jgi:hypothetical protein
MKLILLRSLRRRSTSPKEAEMRLRNPRHRRRSLALDPKAVRISQREILDDLQYPARERRGAERRRG